jgi:hypothetical protein
MTTNTTTTDTQPTATQAVVQPAPLFTDASGLITAAVALNRAYADWRHFNSLDAAARSDVGISEGEAAKMTFWDFYAVHNR